MMPSFWTLVGQISGFVFLFSIYALPSIIALARRHPKRWPIVAVNLIGGMFAGVGWVVAMVWCFIDEDRPRAQTTTVEQLERLERLMQRGILTQEEFNQQKRTLLQESARQ